MKPIVSFDVDMTLLDHKDWTIPDSAMEAIEQLRGNYTIVLATGRDMDSIFSTAIRDRVKPDAIIHLNGTKVTVGDEIIYEHTFDKSLLKQILKYTEKTPYSVGTTVEDYDYYINPEGVKAHDICLWGQSSRKFNDPYKLLELNVRTMAYMGDETGAKAMEEEFPEIHVHMFADKKGADVVERKASKAVGLLRLCDYYKIPLSETIAFGDSMNDYDIIKAAGKGIAMGNAMEELKKAADYVTDPIDQDGIRNACLHFGLIR
ncbi:HAD family hydrolase [Lacrimispora sp.]|uniref:HAD family hydrolase n=1 Tax=Lacrimispora sp. TaxID=2719234 RepID=UPI0028ADC8DF|nr:HAD family hydrolase [Lacrimispora sp.]